MRRLMISGVVLSLGLLTSGLFGAVSIDRTFNVTPGGVLKVRAERCKIAVDTHNGATVEVSISAPDWSAEDFTRDFAVDFRQSGEAVLVEVKALRKSFSWFNWGNREIRIDVRVPNVFDADLETSGGSISVADLSGDVRARTSGGSIRVGRIDGPVWAETSGGAIDLSGTSQSAHLSTSGGSISVGDVAGELDAETSGGSIDVREVLGRARVSTSGGSIKLDGSFGTVDARTSGGSVSASLTRQPDGDCYLGTSGGTVTVSLAGDLRLDIDATASGGNVRTEIPISTVGTLSRTEVKGSINGGGPKLALRTSGGGVNIRKR